MQNELIRNWIKRIIVLMCILVVTICCGYQYYYYHGFSKVDMSRYQHELPGLEYSFTEINYKDADNDFIRGYLSLGGSSVTKYPTRIVFYTDDINIGYSIPVKLSNVDSEGTVVDGAYNNGLYADKTYFDVIVDRFSGFRNTYKIAFLIDVDGVKYLIKTDALYKYSDV